MTTHITLERSPGRPVVQIALSAGLGPEAIRAIRGGLMRPRAPKVRAACAAAARPAPSCIII